MEGLYKVTAQEFTLVNHNVTAMVLSNFTCHINILCQQGVQ